MNKTNLDYCIFKDLTILVVEGDESELEELSELFGVYFKICYSAIDGKDGLEKFVKYRPNIVLADFSMPRIDGLDMSEKIRAIDDEVVIILNTVFADENTFLQAIRSKISGYIIKPTNVRNLLEVLARESGQILKEKELKKKNILMQAILDEFPEPMMVTDLDHNVLFANNQVKNNGFWQKNQQLKCYKVLYGFDNTCNDANHKCGGMEAVELGHNVTHSHENIGKDGEKSYFDIKTIPLKDENDDVYALLETIRDKTSDKKRELALQHLANHDSLTGVPNRILLNDRLGQAILRSDRDKICFAVMFIDFDDFKEVNDTYGHKIGDILLIQATSRMQKLVRKIDTIARIGGDEFVIILGGITNKKQIEDIANQILKKLRFKFDISDKIKIKMSCSIGIDIYNPNEVKKSKEELLQNADFAMYEAKKSAKDKFSFDLEAYI